MTGRDDDTELTDDIGPTDDIEPTDDDTEFMRLAILTALTDWMKRDPDAAERWSHLKPADLPEPGRDTH